MQKIFLVIPILLIFIPSQIFAITPERYSETIKEYCEPEWQCLYSFDHVPGKPFTINLTINDDDPVHLKIISMTRGGGWDDHEIDTVFQGNFQKTYNTIHDEVDVMFWKTSDYKSGLDFELSYSAYKYPGKSVQERHAETYDMQMLALVIAVGICTTIVVIVTKFVILKKK